MSSAVLDSAIEDSPSPQSEAGPSSQRSTHEDAFTGFDVKSFDWNAYEGTYKGRALITRLTHIPGLLLKGPLTTNHAILEIARTALIRAIPHIKETWDHRLYLECVNQIKRTLGKPVRDIGGPAGNSDDEGEGQEDEPMASEGEEGDGVIDSAWVKRVKEEEKREVTKMDVDLRGYMSNLIKESIRVTHLAKAQMAIKSGDQAAAIKSYAAAREYSSSPNHHLEQSLGTLETCLMFNNTIPLTSMIGKLGATIERAYPAPVRSKATGDAGAITANDIRQDQQRRTQADKGRTAVSLKLSVAEALVSLRGKSYIEAGKVFAKVNKAGLGDWEGQAISSSDVALLEGMCILATGSRTTIREDLLTADSFRSALNDDQQWLLEAARLSTEAQYGSATDLIQQATPSILLNPFLASHLEPLMEMIKTRAIVQYIQPFSSVSLSTMSTAISTPLHQVLAEVERLVEKRLIQGRIDLIDQILHIQEKDPRRDAYLSAFDVGSSITASTRAAVIRMKMIEAKIAVNPGETLSVPNDSGTIEEDENQEGAGVAS